MLIPSISFISIRYKLVFLMMLVSIIVVSAGAVLLYQNELDTLKNSAI